LIVPLGRQVLHAACRQLAIWRKRPGCDALLMGVNVSPHQLQDHEFIEHVRSALRASGIPASALVLEVTETVMADPHAVACLHELKQLGILVGLDDFGTGYSSLSYLQQLPIDILKIDKTFIGGIDTHPDRAVLVNTVLRMGRALRLRCVAEGIENADQLELLQRLGCQRGQGFHLSYPLAVDAVVDFLNRAASASASRVRRHGGRDLVALRIGPVPAYAAIASLDHAERVLELVGGSADTAIGVSPGALSLLRHYIDSWRGVAESGPTFTWEGFERVSVVHHLVDEWVRITDRAALVGRIVRPEAAEPFRHAVTSAILVAMEATETEPLDRAARSVRTHSADPRPHPMAAASA
jgi:EAL domain-containing protein (putative c-di-GMP-specific phosphodiesterase class I)